MLCFLCIINETPTDFYVWPSCREWMDELTDVINETQILICVPIVVGDSMEE